MADGSTTSTIPEVPDFVEASAAAPTFVACCARSGSTLLRFLIDAHPEIACPGETDLAVVASGYARIASDLGSGRDPDEVRRGTRQVAEGLMARYLEGTGKARWCDKSLSNVFHLEFLADLWPEARFVLLHRHCMDFVSNGLEVSPWGLAEYGFAQVAEKSPTDSVVALAAYWLDRTSRLLAFEERHQARCVRVRYEDLVTDTDREVDRLLSFLDLAPVTDLPSSAFAADHSTFGAADHEIWYTDGISDASLGTGARIPPDHLAGPLRNGVNELLGRLAYEPVSDAWGAGVDPPQSAPGERDEGSHRLVEVRVVERHAVLARAIADLGDGAWLLENLPSAPFVVAIERRVLEAFARGEENLGTALRSRVVRAYGPLPDCLRDEREVFLSVRAVLAAHLEELGRLADAAPRPAPTLGVTLAP